MIGSYMNSSGRRSSRGRTSPARALAASLTVVILIAVVALAVAACEGGWGTDSVTTERTESTAIESSGEVTDISAHVVPGGDGLVSPAAEVARVLGPSVVNIRCTGASASSYFDIPGQQGYDAEWEGSGVIYTTDGKIITNWHVVTGASERPADEIEVTLATGLQLEATVVGLDPLTDLAVIQVDAGFELPVATFTTEPPVLGEYVVALGSPDGFENSVNLGIVSGLDRTVEVYSTGGLTLYTDLIQTDASISSGNSGGALANVRGQVVGIPSVAVQSVQVENIGFAIPSALVTRIADEIIATGKATHAYLGVSTRTVTEDLQEQFGLSRSSGILVASLVPRGPAAEAGMEQGDIIVMIDGEEMRESTDLMGAIRNKKPGDQVQVIIDRDGVTQTIEVTLEERPANY